MLQSLMGMDAWFFTRVTGAVVDDLKKSKARARARARARTYALTVCKALEFVWRASSSLAAADSELLAHVLESYYCLPLPTFAFEWGEERGAKIPTSQNVLELAHELANITKQVPRMRSRARIGRCVVCSRSAPLSVYF